MGKLKIWTEEQDNILRESFTLFKSKKWKRTSQKLKENGYNRTDVECRQRYVNHLDPNVNKELWTREELQVLYDNYDEHKNKWFIIQKNLPGRTQTKIKNYFYGNIRYLLKIIIKNFLKQSTGFINDVKTNILLDMYQGKNDFQGVNLIRKTIELMEYRVQKKQCIKLIRQNQQEFQRLAKIFLSKYNLRLLMPQSQSFENQLSQISVKKQASLNSQNQASCQKQKQKIKLEHEQEKEIQNMTKIKIEPDLIENGQNLPSMFFNPSFQQFQWQYQFQPFSSQAVNPEIQNTIQVFPNNFYNYPMYYPYE